MQICIRVVGYARAGCGYEVGERERKVCGGGGVFAFHAPVATRSAMNSLQTHWQQEREAARDSEACVCKYLLVANLAECHTLVGAAELLGLDPGHAGVGGGGSAKCLKTKQPEYCYIVSERQQNSSGARRKQQRREIRVRAP